MDSSSLRIIELVAALGLKQIDFARRLGLGPSYISNLKKGATPSPLLLEAVASIYKANIHWLKTGEGEMFAEGDADPFLAHKSESELILAYQRHIKDLNDEVLRLRKENARAMRRAGASERRDEPGRRR